MIYNTAIHAPTPSTTYSRWDSYLKDFPVQCKLSDTVSRDTFRDTREHYYDLIRGAGVRCKIGYKLVDANGWTGGPQYIDLLFHFESEADMALVSLVDAYFAANIKRIP